MQRVLSRRCKTVEAGLLANPVRQINSCRLTYRVRHHRNLRQLLPLHLAIPDAASAHR